MRLMVDGGLSADGALLITIAVLVGMAIAIALGPEPALRRLLGALLDRIEASWRDFALSPRLRSRG